MILFTKKTKNKQYYINEELQQIVVTQEQSTNQFESPALFNGVLQPQSLVAQSTQQSYLTDIPISTKEYPLIIKNQFPRWLRENFDEETDSSRLIKLVEYYYEWLTNTPETINYVDLFYLDKNYDIERTNSNFLEHLAHSYLNSLPPEQIIKDETGGYVTQQSLRSILNNIKVNLYQIKSTPKSFLYVISQLLEIEAEKINIYYPKKHVLRLNGGRFPWMNSYGERGVGEYNLTDNYYPSLGGSYLNRSIIQDNNFWQDYSYLLDTINEDNTDKYKNVVAPLVHPAGMKYFFETGANFFEDIDETVDSVQSEIPIITNYLYYTLESSESLAPCTGCTLSEGPMYVFPDWDAEISTYVDETNGITFGAINIGDFFTLTVINPEEDEYPNTNIATCTIAGC